MKPICDNSNRKPGFTIIELLTVMSIIILLISLLVPALNRVRRYALLVKQRAQFHSISVALDLFGAEYEGYPDSNENDDQGQPYCGAMKLCEAMVGQDLRGFNPKSRFRRADFGTAPCYTTPAPGMLYPPIGCLSATDYTENVRSRKMYLQLENANAYQIRDIYSPTDITAKKFDPNTFVLCDAYNRVTNIDTGKKMGMPILYYKADVTKIKHTASNVLLDLDKNIYDVRDNQELIDMGMPWAPGPVHPFAMGGTTSTGAVLGVDLPAWPNLFYEATGNPKIPGGDRPYREDSYILLSAGFDGEYGTGDDVFNFGE